MALCRGMISWMAAIGCPSVGQNLPSLSNALEGYPGSPFPARINQPRRWSDHTLDSREQISGLICLAFQLAVSGGHPEFLLLPTVPLSPCRHRSVIHRTERLKPRD
jgi:hypothetical protein